VAPTVITARIFQIRLFWGRRGDVFEGVFWELGREIVCFGGLFLVKGRRRVFEGFFWMLMRKRTFLCITLT
jgi:hypothetical protein